MPFPLPSLSPFLPLATLDSSNLKREHALKESPELQLGHLKSKAVAVSSHHLPSVAMSSLPPLTHPCGEPGASGSVFKIEYQGKPAAAKRFHEHMRGMLIRELKMLQLLAHRR